MAEDEKTIGLAQADRGEEVVVIVLQRHLDRLADRFQPGEVDGAADVVLFKNAVQGGAVADVLLVEGHLLPGDLFNPVDGLGGRVYQIVDHNDIHALFQELNAGVASDSHVSVLSFLNQSSRLTG